LFYEAKRLSAALQGARIYLKREDLNHTGAHKINNTLGQVLLAKRMGKTRVIAETGAGQHGVATATACALFGLACVIYMGEEDIRDRLKFSHASLGSGSRSDLGSYPEMYQRLSGLITNARIPLLLCTAPDRNYPDWCVISENYGKTRSRLRN